MPDLGRHSISAVLAVRNEAAVLDRCLSSLDDVVDEIVVVHDGTCEDATVEIAESHGARIYLREWTGNPELQTVFGYEHARGEWLLNLDADEYLSEPLRRQLRALVSSDDVDAYEFLWRMWDGSRYVTANGPFKRVLFRRSKLCFHGLLSGLEQVNGRSVRSTLSLEHRPPYNNFSVFSVLTKWRRWTAIQARQYLADPRDTPAFGCPPPDRWPLARRIANRLSPVLWLPYGLATFAVALNRERGYFTLAQNLRFASYQGIYAAMVQLHVAKFLYLGG